MTNKRYFARVHKRNVGGTSEYGRLQIVQMAAVLELGTMTQAILSHQVSNQHLHYDKLSTRIIWLCCHVRKGDRSTVDSSSTLKCSI